MGLRYIYVQLDEIQELGDRPANLIAYLRARATYADKDGYFACSYSQIEKGLGQKRSVIDRGKKILLSKGLIECVSEDGNRTKYKVRDKNGKEIVGIRPRSKDKVRPTSGSAVSIGRTRYIPRDTSNIRRSDRIPHWTEGLRASLRKKQA